MPYFGYYNKDNFAKKAKKKKNYMKYHNDSYFQSYTENKYSEQQFEWEIPDFFSHTETVQEITFESSSFIFGISMSILRLCRPASSDIWSLYIINENSDFRNYVKMKYLLGFKKVDGCLEEFFARRTDISEECFINYWTNSELVERKPQLTSSDSLTITLTLKSDTSFDSSAPFEELPPRNLIDLNTLSDNFKNMFYSKGSYDVTIQVMDQTFSAHKAVLMARSSVFAAMFEHDMQEKQTGIINVADCDPESFGIFLVYVYSGKVEDVSFPTILHLYNISDKYDVQELKSFCVQYMEQSLAEDNICDVFILAEMNNEAKLLSSARKFFYKNATQIISTPEWKDMMENYSDLVNKLIIEMASKLNV